VAGTHAAQHGDEGVLLIMAKVPEHKQYLCLRVIVRATI
jgi:hypothetical protein